MIQLWGILFGAAATIWASWCLGRILFGAVSLRLYKGEANLLGFVAGSACLSTLVFVLSALHLVNRSVFLVVLAVLTGVVAWRHKYWPVPDPSPAMSAGWKLLFWACYLPFAGMYLMHAGAPEASPDGSSYHLGLVGRYLHDGGFSRITTDFHASLPQGMEMLFLFAYAWGRHSAAALVHCAYLLALPLIILAYARRIGMPAVGVVGGLLIFASPIAGIAGTSAYNDVAVACVLFSSFTLLQIWDEQQSSALLIPAGITAGFALAVKYTAFLSAPYALAFVGYRSWRRSKRAIRPLSIMLLCCSAIVLPTLVKNWLVVRNPVSPFMNRLFPNPYVHVSFENDLQRQMRSYGKIKSISEIPLEATVKGGTLAGLLGPVFLLAPLSLLAIRNRNGRQLLLAALIFALPYPMNIGTRFLLPSAVFLAPALALALSPSRAAAITVLLLHVVLSWPRIVDKYCTSYAWRLNPVSRRAVLRREPEDDYLRRRLAGYDVVSMINEKVHEGARVFSFAAMPDAYCKCELLVGYYSALNERLRDGLYTAAFPPDMQPTRRTVFRIPLTSVSGVRLLQTASAHPDIPGVFEAGVLTKSGELADSRTWRLSAKPFPWDASLAFDRNTITRWRAWQSEYDGMYLEADFGRPVEITGVQFDTAPGDQGSVKWELRGQVEKGSWELLSQAPEQITLPPPDNLRILAIEQLKSHGIEHLLVFNSDYFAQDFSEKTNLWGIEIAGKTAGAILYRFK